MASSPRSALGQNEGWRIGRMWIGGMWTGRMWIGRMWIGRMRIGRMRIGRIWSGSVRSGRDSPESVRWQCLPIVRLVTCFDDRSDSGGPSASDNLVTASAKREFFRLALTKFVQRAAWVAQS